VDIVRATDSHTEEIWQIFHEVVASGDTYVFRPDTSRAEALGYWLSPDVHTFVAVEDERVCGTYILKKNQPDLGSHVANAAYMVPASARSRGVGSLMCAHSLEQARKLGFTAMHSTSSSAPTQRRFLSGRSMTSPLSEPSESLSARSAWRC
jgi:L-amino acid N-acyltransferase YncA